MNFKKKRSFADLLRAALIVLLFIGVPIWLFLIASIINNVWLWLLLLLYVCVAYAFCGRFEQWVM